MPSQPLTSGVRTTDKPPRHFAVAERCLRMRRRQRAGRRCQQRPASLRVRLPRPPEQDNPALSLRTVRLKKKDRPKIDPFNIQDAETLIAAIHRDWGEAQGNYDEFRFFTGIRPPSRSPSSCRTSISNMGR